MDESNRRKQEEARWASHPLWLTFVVTAACSGAPGAPPLPGDLSEMATGNEVGSEPSADATEMAAPEVSAPPPLPAEPEATTPQPQTPSNVEEPAASPEPADGAGLGDINLEPAEAPSEVDPSPLPSAEPTDEVDPEPQAVDSPANQQAEDDPTEPSPEEPPAASTPEPSEPTPPQDEPAEPPAPVVAPPEPDPAPGNLITNPGLENGSAGWTVWSGQLAVTQGFVHTGNSAGVVTNRTETWNGPVHDVLGAAEAGATYQAAAFVSVSGSANVMLSIKVTCNGTEEYINIASSTASPGSWVEVSGSVTLPDCALQEAAFYIEGPPAGIDLHFDDVTFTP